MIAAATEGIAYDHAACEARLVVAGCLELAGDLTAEPDELAGALAILQTAGWLLTQMPLPSLQNALGFALRRELERRGIRVPPLVLLALAA